MGLYTVHYRAFGLNPEKNLVVIKEGFSWLGFLFSGFWALAHGLWLTAAALFLGYGVITGVLMLFDASPTIQLATNLGYSVIIGFLANGGIIARMSFVLLALLWWHYTYMSYKYIKQKQYELHAKYMFISYALTLSAITLRLWKFIIVNYIYEIPPMELYRIISWLGWVPNLIIARILIRKKIHLQILK